MNVNSFQDREYLFESMPTAKQYLVALTVLTERDKSVAVDRRDDATHVPSLSLPRSLADVNVAVVVTEDTFYRSGYYSRRRRSFARIDN